MTAELRIACAGWSLSAAVAADFPVEGSHLQRYAAVLNAVEINSSFYRPHRPATYARWRDSVPEDFCFAVKIPRSISHERRLRDADDLLAPFLAEAMELRHKLGCLLLQLPPSLRFDAGVAATFFSQLRERTSVPVACEPRHASWFAEAAAELMRRHAVACVRADPPPVRDAVPDGYDGIVYLRLHGAPDIYRSRYDDVFLDTLAARIGQYAAHARQVWCVFDNTAEGHAVPNALTLMRLLERRRVHDAS